MDTCEGDPGSGHPLDQKLFVGTCQVLLRRLPFDTSVEGRLHSDDIP